MLLVVELILSAVFGLSFTIYGVSQKTVYDKLSNATVEDMTARQLAKLSFAEFMWLPCLALGVIIDAATVILSALFFLFVLHGV